VTRDSYFDMKNWSREKC